MQRAVTLALCGLTALALSGCGKKEGPAAAPPEVVVADVVQRDVPVYVELVGQTKGSQDVEIRARVEGYLNRVAFTEGSFVRKGQLLYEIDPLPLEAALANAKANLATAKARLDKSNTDVNRLTPLAKQQAVSQQELDNALSAQDASRAQMDAQKAAVDKATLDLGYAHITAPLDGLVGTTAGQGRQPRRPRREHAPDDRLPDEPDPLPRWHQRGRVPADRQAGRGDGQEVRPEGLQGRGDDRAAPRRRHPAPAQGPASRPSSARSTRRPAPSPSSSPSRTPTGSCAPGSTAAPDSSSRRSRAPSSSRSER